jgi:ubiquinone/menaquinone biosynthesis C-methylase UbiE
MEAKPDKTTLRNDPRAEYEALAHRYDRRWAAYVEASNRETLKRTPLAPGMQILDVGCGTGAFLAALNQRQPEAAVTGTDLSERMLRVAGSKPDVVGELVCADWHDLPFRDHSFDLVLSVSVLHYVSSPERALAETRRVLKPGGRLVLTDWCRDFAGCRFIARVLPLLGRAHVRTYGAGECRELLQAAGFKGISVETYKISPFWGLMTALAISQ